MMDTRTSHPVYIALVEAKDRLQSYLAGTLSMRALRRWAEEHPLHLRGQDEAPADMRCYGQLLDSVIGTVLLMHPSEPEAYRSTAADIEEALHEIEALLAQGPGVADVTG